MADDVKALFALMSELGQQLSHNRVRAEELQLRAEELKASATHASTGYALRRFNTDVSQEEFDTELEKLNVSLVSENQALQQENRHLSALLKDYESTLEAIMAKFRAHAYATQQHHLELVRHYENILLNQPQAQAVGASSEEGSMDPDILYHSISHLGSLVRKAMRALNGEDPDANATNSPMIFPAGVGGGPRTGTAGSLLAGSRDTDASKRDESEGGYIGRPAKRREPERASASSQADDDDVGKLQGLVAPTLNDYDDALEREIELEALRRENDELRRLLQISSTQQQQQQQQQQAAR